jgi:hypothetical protein
MANGDTTASRLGADNQGVDKDALFLKVFAGEILTTFEEMNIMKDLHMVRTIQNGKSAQFPVTGIATAKYHTPGQSIADAGNSYLTNMRHSEKIITIDDLLVASTFIANIDELRNHYDVRSIYAKELGKALAKRFDIATMKTLCAGALSAATITGGYGGTNITTRLAATPTATELVDSIVWAAQQLDEKDVPEDERFAILKPRDYYTILGSDDTAMNNLYGGSGNIATGQIATIAGIKLYKSTHLGAVTNGASGLTGDALASFNNDALSKNDVFGGAGVGYNATDLAAYEMIVAHPSAIGTVKLLDLATESEYQIDRQGTLFVAKYAMGHGVLRPEAAVLIG